MLFEEPGELAQTIRVELNRMVRVALAHLVKHKDVDEVADVYALNKRPPNLGDDVKIALVAQP